MKQFLPTFQKSPYKVLKLWQSGSTMGSHFVQTCLWVSSIAHMADCLWPLSADFAFKVPVCTWVAEQINLQVTFILQDTLLLSWRSPPSSLKASLYSALNPYSCRPAPEFRFVCINPFPLCCGCSHFQAAGVCEGLLARRLSQVPQQLGKRREGSQETLDPTGFCQWWLITFLTPVPSGLENPALILGKRTWRDFWIKSWRSLLFHTGVRSLKSGRDQPKFFTFQPGQTHLIKCPLQGVTVCTTQWLNAFPRIITQQSMDKIQTILYIIESFSDDLQNHQDPAVPQGQCCVHDGQGNGIKSPDFK